MAFSSNRRKADDACQRRDRRAGSLPKGGTRMVPHRSKISKEPMT
jgi:hypothetical protein